MSKRRTFIVATICFLSTSVSGQVLEYITADELRRMQMDTELVLIDVRIPYQFQAKHIEGAVNIPYNVIKDTDLPKENLLVLYCSSEGCPISVDAAHILMEKGYENVRVLKGGLTAWEKESKMRSPRKIAAKKVLAKINKGEIVILDVRPFSQFKAGHLPGAINVPLENLPAEFGSIPADGDLVVYDRRPKRSQEAARILMDAGYNVFELSGGLAVWAARGYPIEAGTVKADSK